LFQLVNEVKSDLLIVVESDPAKVVKLDKVLVLTGKLVATLRFEIEFNKVVKIPEVGLDKLFSFRLVVVCIKLNVFIFVLFELSCEIDEIEFIGWLKVLVVPTVVPDRCKIFLKIN